MSPEGAPDATCADLVRLIRQLDDGRAPAPPAAGAGPPSPRGEAPAAATEAVGDADPAAAHGEEEPGAGRGAKTLPGAEAPSECLTALMAHIQRLNKELDSAGGGSGGAVQACDPVSPSGSAVSPSGSEQAEMKRYAAFLQKHRRLRRQQRLPDGPLEAVLSSPERHAQSGELSPMSQGTSQAPAVTATPREYESFLKRHKDKRRKFKAMVSSVCMKANESIPESPAEGAGDPDLGPLPRTLSETKLSSEEGASEASSILYYPHRSDAECLSPRSASEVLNESTSPWSRASSGPETLTLLLENTASLMARLSTIQADHVPDLLQEMGARNVVAAALASELESSEREATVTASIESEAGATEALTTSTPNKAANIKRSMSFNTQAQLDTLVTEAGALLTRLSSADARGISELLEDISGDNMLAAILSAELGPRSAAIGGSFMSASIEHSAACQQPADGAQVENALTAAASPVVSEVSAKNSILKRSSSGLKKSVSFNSQEQLGILLEDAASLVARLSSTEPVAVPEVLQEMSDRNQMASCLAGGLEDSGASSPKEKLGFGSGGASSPSVPTLKEDGQFDAVRNEDSMQRYAEFLAANRRKRQNLRQKTKFTRSMSFNTREQVDTLVSEAGDLLTRLQSADAEGILDLLQEIKDNNMLAALLWAELKQNTPQASPERAETSGEQLTSVVESEAASAPMLKSSKSDEELELLLEATGSLLARLNSAEAGGMTNVLEEMSSRNTVAAAVLSEMETGISGVARTPSADRLAAILSAKVASSTQKDDKNLKEDDVSAAHSLKEQPASAVNESPPSATARTLSLDTSEGLKLLEEELGALLVRLDSANAAEVVGIIQDMSSRNMLAAVLSSTLEQTQERCPAEDIERAADAAIQTNSVGRRLSIGTQQDLDDLIRESNTLLSKLASSDVATVSDTLLELSRERNALAQILVDATSATRSRGMQNKPNLKKTNSLVEMFKALQMEGVVVETKLGKSGSFRVSDPSDEDDVVLRAQEYLDADDQNSRDQPALSSLTKTMLEFRSQAAATRRAIQVSEPSEGGGEKEGAVRPEVLPSFVTLLASDGSRCVGEGGEGGGGGGGCSRRCGACRE